MRVGMELVTIGCCMMEGRGYRWDLIVMLVVVGGMLMGMVGMSVRWRGDTGDVVMLIKAMTVVIS